MKRTRDIFNLCDADGDGIITKSELFKLVKELGYDVVLLVLLVGVRHSLSTF